MRRAWLAALLAVCACVPAPATPTPASAASATPSAATLASPSPPPSPAAEPTAAPEPTPAPTPIALPRCASAAASDVMTLCIPGARIDIDLAVGESDALAIARQVAADLEAVQSEFQWTLRATARIDVYATNAAYAGGLRDVFGYSQTTADYLADNSVAFFEPSLRRIALSWESVRDRRPIAALRHELTHFATLEACAPRCDLVPAWFNEGEARLMEALIPGADWRMMRVRYETASMVATHTVLPLTSLWTQAQWNAYGDWDGYYKYQQAARVTQLVRDDVGDRAIARIYERIRLGEDLPTAYERLTRKTWLSFNDALQSRLAGDIAPGPAIELVTPGADGTGVSYLLYGFAPEAKITLHITARYADATSEVAASPQGAYFGSIDATYPPGEYKITAASGSVLAAVTVVKRGGRPVRASD